MELVEGVQIQGYNEDERFSWKRGIRSPLLYPAELPGHLIS